jgi:hypothetical protein
VRGDGVSHGINAYWERTANSIVEVGGESTFCLKGVLNADLPASAIEGSTLDVPNQEPRFVAERNTHAIWPSVGFEMRAMDLWAQEIRAGAHSSPSGMHWAGAIS